jgi:hypothetical protein
MTTGPVSYLLRAFMELLRVKHYARELSSDGPMGL